MKPFFLVNLLISMSMFKLWVVGLKWALCPLGPFWALQEGKGTSPPPTNPSRHLKNERSKLPLKWLLKEDRVKRPIATSAAASAARIRADTTAFPCPDPATSITVGPSAAAAQRSHHCTYLPPLPASPSSPHCPMILPSLILLTGNLSIAQPSPVSFPHVLLACHALLPAHSTHRATVSQFPNRISCLPSFLSPPPLPLAVSIYALSRLPNSDLDLDYVPLPPVTLLLLKSTQRPHRNSNHQPARPSPPSPPTITSHTADSSTMLCRIHPSPHRNPLCDHVRGALKLRLVSLGGRAAQSGWEQNSHLLQNDTHRTVKIRLGEIRVTHGRRLRTVTSSASRLAGRRLSICSHLWGLPGALLPRSSEGGVSSCRSSIGRVWTRWVWPRGGRTT